MSVDAALDLVDNSFTGNISQAGDGGAVQVLNDDYDVWVQGNRFCENTALGAGGGIVLAAGPLNDSRVSFHGNIFVGNEASLNADIHASNAPVDDLEYVNNTFLAAMSDSDQAAIRLPFPWSKSNPFKNNILAHIDPGGGLTGSEAAEENTEIWFNNFYDITGPEGVGDFEATYSGDDDNIAQDPEFAGWKGNCWDDLRLSGKSALIDAGDPTYSDTDGSRSDIGAYGGPDPFESDLDDDGYTDWRGFDCDDSDATTYPGAKDSWYDGVDSNCDGASDYDADGDGYDHDGYGGTDCDDTSADVWPGAEDAWYDGVDSDCDGASDYDADGDDYDSDEYGGTDCDDTNAGVNPGAADPKGDGLDTDCDGKDGASSGDDSGIPGGDDTGVPGDTGSPTNNDSASPDDDTGSGGAGGGDNDDEKGCGCAVHDHGSLAWVGACALLLVFRRRDCTSSRRLGRADKG